MKLYGYELSPMVQNCHLIRTNQVFDVVEIERGSGTGLRRFKLFEQDTGKPYGILYEDRLPARFLDA